MKWPSVRARRRRVDEVWLTFWPLFSYFFFFVAFFACFVAERRRRKIRNVERLIGGRCVVFADRFIVRSHLGRREKSLGVFGVKREKTRGSWPVVSRRAVVGFVEHAERDCRNCSESRDEAF